MPITDHEKQLQVHSRPSSHLLAAVPIKKRRFFYTRSPSPPPKSSSQIPADCDVSENKQESSGLGTHCSKTGTTSAQANIVKGEGASCESRNPQPQTAADFGIPEKKPESSELVSPFSITACNPALGNSVTGQCDSLSECCMSEKKPECPRTASSFSTIVGNPVQVNAVAGENASHELPPAGADCGLSELQTKPSEQPGSIFSKTAVNSTPVKAITGENTSHEHCEFPYAKLTHSGAIEKKREPLNKESPSSKPSCYSSQANSGKVTDASSESCEKLMDRDVTICPKPEILPSFNDQVSGLNLAANYLDGSCIAQEMAFNSKCAAWPVSGSMVTHSATKETLLPARDGTVEGKLTPREGISVKQEASELHNHHSTPGDSKAKTDASCLCLNRSNWDLNTTMDAWEGSSAGSLLKNGAADFAVRGLGGIPNKRLEVGLKQILTREPIGIDMTPENHLVQKDNRRLKLPNSSTSAVDSNSGTCLDLQLKPFSLPNLSNISAEHDSSRDAPFLSLGMKPMPITTGLPVAAGRIVKSEPVENDQKDAGNVQPCVLKSQDLKHVKSELCERQDISKVSSAGKMNAACSVVIKQEPLGDQSQGYVKSVEGSMFPVVGQNCHSIDTQNIQMHLNAGIDEDMDLDVASKSLIVNTVLHPCMDKPNINIPNDSSGMIDKAQDLVNQASIPGNYMSNISLTNDSSDMVDKAHGLTDKASIHVNELSNSTQSSALVSKFLISYRQDINSLPEACETSSFPVTSTGDGCVSSEGVPELVVQMDALNGQHSSQESLTNGVLGKPCANGKVVKSGVVDDKDGVSSEVLEESNSPCKSDSSRVAAGAINTVRKQCGKDDEEFEDGEVRNPALNGTCEGSSGVTEEQEVKAVGSVCPSDVTGLAPLLVDENDTKVATLKTADILMSKESDGGLVEKKVEPSSSLASSLTADSGKKGSSETNCRTPKEHLKNDKGLESKFKYSDIGRKRSLSISSSKQQNADVPSLVRRNVSSETEPDETEPSVKAGNEKDASDKGDDRRIIYLNSISNSLASEKEKSSSDMSISSPEGSEMPADRLFRREGSHSQGSRDETYNERSQKVETERHYGHAAEKSKSDFLRSMSRTDRLNALHGGRNSNPDHQLEQISSSNGIRYSRRSSAAEVAIGTSPDGSKRLARKLTSEEVQNQTHLPCQRRSQGGRRHMPLGCHPKRAFSPSRRIERDVPDFVLHSREEKLLRNMHELAPPRSRYGRAEGILVHRERRSLSPQMRRGGPLQILPNCPKSSPRSQQRPTPHWSPSARTSDGFNGPRELGHCRSPPPVRINRMQPTHERRRFPEEVMIRRRGSPPYHARLPDDMVDADPSREHGFPRLVRSSSRNVRRFNMIDPREMMEEEYFGPPLVHNQIREFGVDDGFVDDRRGDERREPLRSFRQRCITGDNESESFQFLVEDGPPRELRLRPASNEGFPEGSGRRNFDVRFRNRLGNPSGRMRDIAQEQEDNYRHHGEEWQETTFNDGRTKRRRF